MQILQETLLIIVHKTVIFVKRRQRWDNNENYTFDITMIQTGKLCVTTPLWDKDMGIDLLTKYNIFYA